MIKAGISVVAVRATAISLALLMSGCADRPYNSPEEQAHNACQALGPKTLSGALIGGLGGAAGGAGLGALAGGGKGAAIGAGIGVLAGLIGGAIVGNQIDKRDCYEAQLALQQIRYKDVGQVAAWNNTATGSSGSYTALTPESAYANGRICRQVRQDTTLKDQAPTSQMLLTCRTADGNYESVQPIEASNTTATQG